MEKRAAIARLSERCKTLQRFRRQYNPIVWCSIIIIIIIVIHEVCAWVLSLLCQSLDGANYDGGLSQHIPMKIIKKVVWTSRKMEKVADWPMLTVYLHKS